MKINKKRIIGAFSLVVILALCLTVYLSSVYATSYTDNIIPQMTSDTTPSGIASCSNFWSETPVWKAFDKINVYNDAEGYHAWATPNTSGWLAYDFQSEKKIAKYLVIVNTNTANAPKSWTFEGTNDDTNWTILDTRNNFTWSGITESEFVVQNPGNYKKYKMNITENNGQTGYTVNLVIHELSMMEEVAELQSVSINPSSATIEVGNTVNLTATATYSDSTTQNATNNAIWSSNNESVATVDNNGIVTGISTGSATITATYQGVSSNPSTSITVAAPPTNNRALLSITMVNGFEKEYDLTKAEIDSFISWYDNRANGSGKAYYTFDKAFNKGPFSSRKDNIVFDKIMTYEVMEYNQ